MSTHKFVKDFSVHPQIDIGFQCPPTNFNMISVSTHKLSKGSSVVTICRFYVAFGWLVVGWIMPASWAPTTRCARGPLRGLLRGRELTFSEGSRTRCIYVCLSLFCYFMHPCHNGPNPRQASFEACAALPDLHDVMVPTSASAAQTFCCTSLLLRYLVNQISSPDIYRIKSY